MAKPHGNGKLSGLPLRQVETIVGWLLEENLTYKDTVARLQEVMGIQVSQVAVKHFWDRECVPRKLHYSAVAAAAVQQTATASGVDWQKANSQLIGQRIFELLAGPDTDVKSVALLSSILEKSRAGDLHGKALVAKVRAEQSRQGQKDRELALEREKFEFKAVDAALAHAPAIRTITDDGALSSEEKREQVRRLLFPQLFADDPAAPAAS